MKYRGFAARLSLVLLAGALLLTVLPSASLAQAPSFSVLALGKPGATTTLATGFDPYGLYVSGIGSDDNGTTTYAVRWDLLPWLQGGSAAVSAFPGPDSGAYTVNALGQLGGFIGSEAAIWNFQTVDLVTVDRFHVDNFDLSVQRLANNGRALLHASQTGFLPLSGVGDAQPGSLTNFTWFNGDSATAPVVWDISSSFGAGSSYSRTTADRFPLLARSVNGAWVSQQIVPAAGFPQGTNGGLFAVTEGGDGAGYLRKPGGLVETAVFGVDGSSVALGIPDGYDTAYLIGRSVDSVVAIAGKTGTEVADPFFRAISPGSPWMPLSALLPADSGWTDLDFWGMNDLGMVGGGTLQGKSSAFALVPSWVASHTGTVTADAAAVVGGNPIQITFKFTQDPAHPAKIAHFAMASPLVSATGNAKDALPVLSFDPLPTGASLANDGKDLFVPIPDGATEISIPLRTLRADALDRNYSARLIATAVDQVVGAQATALGVTELTVRRQ